MKRVLLTGGAGFIGSHTVVALSEAGYEPIVVDDFSNSSPEVLPRLRRLIGRSFRLERLSVLDGDRLARLLDEASVEAVIHFAAFKAVGESARDPIGYYRNNVGGMLSLLDAMQRSRCRRIVLSSSATVYGAATQVPIPEESPRSATNPYGHTKIVCEDVLYWLQQSDPRWQAAILRYFNPVGAHPSGLIGEDPVGEPNNLMPYVAQVAAGARPMLNVFGNDYDTHDGTGVRDYIHVQDLAEGHVAALQRLLRDEDGSFAVNLGTGTGFSVLEVIRTFEQVSGRKVPFEIKQRRAGDVATCYADPSRAHALLGWHARRTLRDMCRDAWNWQQKNPLGYRTASAAPQATGDDRVGEDLRVHLRVV